MNPLNAMNHEHSGMPMGYPGSMNPHQNPHHRHSHPHMAHMMQNAQQQQHSHNTAMRDGMFPGMTNPMLSRMQGPLNCGGLGGVGPQGGAGNHPSGAPGGQLPSPGQQQMNPHDPVNWTCPTDPRKKRPRAPRKGAPQHGAKGASIWDRLSPCPNVDVRTLAKDGKLPPHLDNPRLFMEAQEMMLGQSFEEHELHGRPSRTSSAGWY